MSNLSIFDIAGPIMVGPSSSHTAGACKIGQFARALFHETPFKVTFYLHGSFGEVYAGHATDRALLGGVMKFQTSDPRIRDSFKIADDLGLKYEFIVKDLGDQCHPNTVLIVMENDKSKMSVMGSSIGGGMIEIVKIDDFDVKIHGRAGKYLSLVVAHENNPSVIRKLKEKIENLGDRDIKVAGVEKASFKDKALHIVNLDGRRIRLDEIKMLEKSDPKIEFIRSLSKVSNQ